MIRGFYLVLCCVVSVAVVSSIAQNQQTSASASKENRSTAKGSLDPGSVASAGIYRNKTLGLACTIPAGWVLRTEEMNSQDTDTSPLGAQRDTENKRGGKVLLAAFARPPEAKGTDINSSILIAAESLSTYPGLKDPEQYFEPLTEVAKAQGFVVDEEPYEFTIGTKTLVRGDFHKDVGTRVMRQSTLVLLSHGYAISITVIAGSAGDVEDLIGGLDFTSPGRSPAQK